MKTVIVFLTILMCSSFKLVNADRNIDAKQAILMDAETGDCLYEMNAEERCAPSSMTKLMVLYILFSAIDSGRINLKDKFLISKIAQKMKGSRSFFTAGSLVCVEDLIRSVVVHSGNDACVAIAEGMYGDVESFVDQMNKKAKEFGLKNTNFTNPSGLPDEDHFSSVHDIASVASKLIADFPQFYHYFSEKVFTINSITQQNRNTLLGNALKVDGLKTGKTNSGGYGIAVSAKNNGKRLIAVVNGCTSARGRARAANELLALGLREYTSLKIVEAGKPVSEITVNMGEKDKVGLCTHEDVNAVISKKYRKSLQIVVIVKEPVDAPLDLGRKFGELVYKYGNFTSQKYDLFAVEPIKRSGFFPWVKVVLWRLIYGKEDAKEVVKNPIINIPQD
ncbi:MAG: D-alanyl-D-alanine carboxypeptidase [Holosporaceae bacterium]|nr:D-alanyl-D-alanine carboxypeptidase [Holosporaceae bacterium]